MDLALNPLMQRMLFRFYPYNIEQHIILILKFHIYGCKNSEEKPSLKIDIAYLKYCIRIKQNTLNFLSPTQKEYID